MIATPWYLMAVGVGLVIIGLLAAGFRQVLRSGPSAIDPRMRDDQIAKILRDRQRAGFPVLIVYAGVACVFASVVWRGVRWALALAG